MDLLAETKGLGATLPWLIVLLMATAYLMRRSYRYFGRRNDSRPIAHVPRPGKRGPAPLDLAGELARQEVQLHETARDLSARLDSKTSVLLQLVSRAERQIARLESLLEIAERGQSRGGDEETERSPAGIGHVLPGVLGDSSEESTPVDPSQAEVLALAGQGFSAVTIAHKVGRSLTDVQEILDRLTAP